MKKTRYSEEQIIGVLKQMEAGQKVADLAREILVSEGTLYAWKSKFGGLEAFLYEGGHIKVLYDRITAFDGPGLFRFLYATMYVAAASGREYATDERIVEISQQPVPAEIVAKVHELVAAAWGRLGSPGRKLHRNEDFQKPLIAKATQIPA